MSTTNGEFRRLQIAFARQLETPSNLKIKDEQNKYYFETYDLASCKIFSNIKPNNTLQKSELAVGNIRTSDNDVTLRSAEDKCTPDYTEQPDIELTAAAIDQLIRRLYFRRY